MGGGGPGWQPEAPRYSVSDAFNYGWKKFQENLGAWILGVLILFIGLVVIQLIYQLLVGGALGSMLSGSVTTQYNPVTGVNEVTSVGGGFWAALLLSFLLAIPIALLGMAVQAQFVRAALGTTEGKIELSKFFETRLLGPVILAAILAGLLTLLGVLACYVGAIVVWFFVQFYAYFVLDREQSPWQAIKSSFSFVNQHLANVFILLLASLVANLIGALLCGIGLLVSVPVVLIAQAYTYKVLSGKPVAP